MFNNIVNKYGKTFTMDHKVVTMGFHTREAAQKIVEMLELPMSVDEFVTEWNNSAGIFSRCQMMPGNHQQHHLMNFSSVQIPRPCTSKFT